MSGKPDEAVRYRFETWARSKWRHREDFDQRIGAPRGTYNNIEVQAAWEAWQALTAAQQRSDGEVIQRHVVTKYNDGSVQVADVTAPPPSAPVGVKTLSEFMAEQEALHPGIHDKVQAATDELRASLAQQPAAVGRNPAHAWPAVDRLLIDAYNAGTDGTELDLIAARRKIAALAQQPAAVDEAAAIRAFEEHFQASSDDPYFEGELELWLTAWRKALAAQHQEPSA